MKKRLLSLMSALLISTAFVSAQTTTWDFGNDTTNWPVSSGIGTAQIVKLGLGLFPISTNSNFGTITKSSSVTFPGPPAYASSEGDRFQTNGGGAPTAGTYTPTQRYFFIQVDKACTVTVWFKSGTGGSVRSVFVSNGSTTLYGSGASSPSYTPADGAIVNATIPAAGTFYIYADAAVNIYQIQVNGANVTTTMGSNTLATSEPSVNKISTVVFSEGNKVYVSKVSGDTKVNIYNTNGGLVKSINTKSDINFELKTGIYIVNVQSDKGVKSQKVLIK